MVTNCKFFELKQSRNPLKFFYSRKRSQGRHISKTLLTSSARSGMTLLPRSSIPSRALQSLAFLSDVEMAKLERFFLTF